MASYTFATNGVKVHLSGAQNLGAQIAVSGIELRAVSGGANIATVSGNCSCLSGTAPANAIDGDPATYFSASGSDAIWRYQDLVTPFTPVEIKITALNDVAYQQAPTKIVVYLLDPNTKRYNQIQVMTGLSWTIGESKVFTIGNGITADRQSRIYGIRSMSNGVKSTPVTQPPVSTGVTIAPQFSVSSDKSSPQTLSGQTVSGVIYVFLPNTDPLLTAMDFWIDSATPSAPTEAISHTESFAPFDLWGSSGTSPYGPVPWDTSTLSDGTHTISIRLTYNGVVQPIYYVTLTSSNTTSVVHTTWPTGSENLGTAKNNGFFTAIDAFRGRATNFTTVNGIGFSLNDMAYASSGVRGWNFFGTSYWPATSWYTGIMHIQVNPAGLVNNMFLTSGGIIVSATQAAYDQLMLDQANGLHDADWYQIGISFATVGRNSANTILTLAHEFNGTWYPWNPKNTSVAVWTQMFQRAVTNFRNGFKSVLPSGSPPRIGWCYTTNPDPAKGGNYSCSNVWDYYPGDAYVDVIVLDDYDGRNWNNNNFSSWTSFRPWHNSSAAAIDHCVQQKAFGGPQVAWGEWNIQNGDLNATTGQPPGAQWLPAAQDNPTYIQRMYDMFSYCRDHGIMAGECLFHEGSAGSRKELMPKVSTAGSSAKNTLAASLWQTLWSA